MRIPPLNLNACWGCATSEVQTFYMHHTHMEVAPRLERIASEKLQRCRPVRDKALGSTQHDNSCCCKEGRIDAYDNRAARHLKEERMHSLQRAIGELVEPSVALQRLCQREGYGSERL